MNMYLQVALGGALGATARFAVARSLPWGVGWPLATLLVNVLGSFLMGIAAVAVLERLPAASPLVMTGILGGFTTFSAFSLEAVTLFERGAFGVALGYIAGSVVLCVLAAFAGLVLARGIWA